MCNANRYVDRNPDLRAAGIANICGVEENVSNVMKVYPQVELEEAWLKSLCAKKPQGELFPSSIILPTESVHEVFAPELLKSRFAKFKEQFFEDLYLKKAKLGTTKLVHCIPEGITNENRTFGIRTRSDGNLYDLILPQKSVAEVNREYINWHNKYLISHNHYLPGERVNRNYNEKFDAKASFGVKSNVDITGAQVRRCMNPKEMLSVVKKLQEYYLQCNFDNVGKKIPRFKDPHLEDPQRIYGHPPNYDKCTLRDIVHNIETCEQDQTILDAIAYVIRQRNLLLKNPQFDEFTLEKNLEKQDPDKTGYIPLETAFFQARLLHIYLNERKMRDALIFYKLVEDVGLPTERIKIENFSKTLQFRYLLPEIAVERVNPAHELDTTYRELCRDHLLPLPPTVPHFKKAAEIPEDLSSPEVFNKPREKAQLKRIFADIVCSDTFDRIWKVIRQQEASDSDLMSINAFRAELKNQRKLHEPVKT